MTIAPPPDPTAGRPTFPPGLRLLRNSPGPLYYQVALHLEDAIRGGAITSGTLIDGEIALAAELGVSRDTLRAAMKYLEGRGLVVRSQGRGTLVA